MSYADRFRYEYLTSMKIEAQGYPFYALIMAAIRQADTDNLELLKTCWPEIYNAFQVLYNTPMEMTP